MKALFILNDAPYGSERIYNGLRLAGSLSKQEEVELRVFLIGDAVAGAHKGQKVPSGYYNVQAMLGAVVRHEGVVGVCGSCMDARGGQGDRVLGETGHGVRPFSFSVEASGGSSPRTTFARRSRRSTA